MSPTIENIPVVKYPARIMTIDAPNGRSVYLRQLRGVKLISRSDLIEFFAGKHHVDRLVAEGYLTPYFPNGEIKKRMKNGRMPSGQTFYDWDEFMQPKYNEMYS